MQFYIIMFFFVFSLIMFLYANYMKHIKFHNRYIPLKRLNHINYLINGYGICSLVCLVYLVLFN